jgi:hypothetical protein
MFTAPFRSWLAGAELGLNVEMTFSLPKFGRAGVVGTPYTSVETVMVFDGSVVVVGEDVVLLVDAPMSSVPCGLLQATSSAAQAEAKKNLSSLGMCI